MAKNFTLNDIGRMLEILVKDYNQPEWVSGYDLRTKFGLKRSEIERYRLLRLVKTKPIKSGSQRLYYDISKIKHLLNQNTEAHATNNN